ncbi:MAG: sigma-70 family RNA polymerase sigma factor [Gemmatimonadetes bacterium]|nr:sigma-70 family RNA polymerase sigma factor [Gemmatimonadota bacterium]
MTPEIGPLVDRLFREEAGRLTALLTRLLGVEHMELAEDVVQEAFIAALGHWPRGGVPATPAAWLLQVAKRKAIDAMRRDRAFDQRIPEISAELEEAAQATLPEAVPSDPDSSSVDDPFADDRLRMILLCCHPAVSPDSRVALTLKVVSGFGVAEIARAFLADERAIAQRLVRAKRALRDAGATFDMPDGPALNERLESVREVLYLMFNEGHVAHAGDQLVRHELSAEALRLTERLTRHASTASPTTHALAALFCFNAARFTARTGPDGAAVRLAEQDRSLWDGALIARGFHHLEAAATGSDLTAYHVEAEIASIHMMAPAWSATDWARIIAGYDRLMALTHSPVVALNRVVALRELRGAAAAWVPLEALVKEGSLDRYPLLHAVRGALLAELGHRDKAIAAWARARELTASGAMQRQMDQRLDELAELRPGNDVDSGGLRPS